MNEETMTAALHSKRIPVGLHDGLILWVSNGTPPGDFLWAVLVNDLMGAFARADDDSKRAMGDLVMWLYNNSPAGCFGSVEKVRRWADHGGIGGMS